MKQEPDFFEGKEPTLIYIAKRLKDALALEEILTNAGVDYGVEPDRYRGGFVFQSAGKPSSFSKIVLMPVLAKRATASSVYLSKSVSKMP